MDHRIEELIEFTREKYGLNQYYLQGWDISRETTIYDETVYRLRMEWFPNHIQDWDDEESNPEGTASVEIDIHSRKLKRAIFVGGISYSESMIFDWNNKQEIFNWIERETGLKYLEQFELWREEERELHFKGRIDGFAFSPSAFIDCSFNEEGRLTYFSVYGKFPPEKLVKKESYILSLEQVEELVKNQLKLAEFPLMKKQKLVPAFAVEEIYIKNDGRSTLAFDFFVDENSRLPFDKTIEWNQETSKPFNRTPITLIENVTLEQAFRCDPHPDLQPISEEEIKKCIIALQIFLSQEYADDSGKWSLKALHRENGYIHATLQLKKQKERVFKRKMKVFIDSKTNIVLNYMDNKLFLDMYKDLKEAEEIKVTKEEAFTKLRHYMELTPYYVYDFEQGRYVLCGKLDCHYAVKADSGEVVEMSEL